MLCDKHTIFQILKNSMFFYLGILVNGLSLRYTLHKIKL